ncbi:LysR family transcriptional regulator [Cellulomonas hominis]
MHDLEHFRTFLAVYRAGSLSEAARSLGISQPTASAHVQALEQHLGVRLFDRTSTGVVATGKAADLAREVAPHVDALDDLAYVPDLAGGARLDLGGPAELLTEVVLPRVPELTVATAGRLRVRFGLADDLLADLRTGALDLVVSAVRPRVQGITGRPLLDEEFVLVAAPAWRANRTSPDLSEQDLVAIPVVAYAENLPIVRRYWRTVFGRRPDDLRTTVVVPDLRGVRTAVVGGAGMSVLPRYLVTDELAAGALVLLHDPEVAPLNTVYLATRAGDLERRGPLRDLAATLERIVAG